MVSQNKFGAATVKFTSLNRQDSMETWIAPNDTVVTCTQFPHQCVSTSREICFPTRVIHRDGRRVSTNAFECRLFACCGRLPSVPRQPSWRLHYDFFARDRGGEAAAQAASNQRSVPQPLLRRREPAALRNAAKLAHTFLLPTALVHIHRHRCSGGISPSGLSMNYCFAKILLSVGFQIVKAKLK